MTHFRVLIARVRALFRQDAIADEIREELNFHIAMREKALKDSGLLPNEAHRLAARHFGNVAIVQDRGFDLRGGGWLETVVQDVRFGLRLLVKDHVFSVTAIVTLMLAIGVSTALFSVIDAALLRPLPYTNPEQLVDVTTRIRRPNGQLYGALAPSFDDVQQWKKASASVFAHLGQARPYNEEVIVDAGQPERVMTGLASDDFLAVLGITPSIGRDISADDTQPSAPAVVLLGDDYWRLRFEGNRGVLGRTIRVDGQPAMIIGVLPKGFYASTAIWRPLRQPESSAMWVRGSGTPTWGRLKPGLSPEVAAKQLTDFSLGIATAAGRNTAFDVRTRSLYEQTVGAYRSTMNILTAAVVAVLLIACINLAGLLMARGASRMPELAIRASIGAGRIRLLRQLLTESVVLALAGGLGGVFLCWLCLDGLVAILPLSLPDNAAPAINLQVLTFATVLSLATSLVFGLAPALRLSRVRLSEHLGRAGRGRGAALSRRGGQILIALEVTLAVVLLTGTGLMLRSLARAQSIDVGFDPAAFVTLEVFPVDPSPAVREQYFAALLGAVRALPGIAAAGAVDFAPLSRGSMYTEATAKDSVMVAVKGYMPGYFEALGLTPLLGRLPDQGASKAREAVLSERAARRLFPDGAAIGSEVRLTDKSTWTIAAVVRDIRGRDVFQAEDIDVYLPFGWSIGPFATVPTIVVRPVGPIAGLADRLRRTAQQIGPPVIIGSIRPGSEWFSNNLMTPQRRTVLLSLLGGLGLVMALVGVFGVTAYAVATRTREIGVRMTFGARPVQVVSGIVRDAVGPAAIGLGFGLAAAWFATKGIASFLFETSPRDLLTFAGVTLLTAVVATLAAWLPARRAARVDPVAALRAE